MGQPDEPPGLVQRMIASRRSHDRGLRPRFVYRQPPMSPSDSGWSALVGDESPQELDDPGALVSLEVGALLERWPELGPVLESGTSESQWAWDEEQRQYVPVTEQA